MYCINCGVQLAERESRCPICSMPVVLPEGVVVTGKPLYPQRDNRVPEKSGKGFVIAMSVLYTMALAVVVLCDGVNGRFSWCGYAVGGMLLSYVGMILPGWFRKPNPVIFVPCFFAAAALYLLYINLVSGGKWFLSFAFPVVGSVCLLVTTVVTLLRYLRRGRLYIFGGGLLGFGGLFLLLEFLLTVTFPRVGFIGWSVYPLAALFLLGGFLIFLGICRPARQIMKRKLFF